MSDFILSTKSNQIDPFHTTMLDYFNSIYHETIDFTGEWGTLTTVPNHYAGWNPYESDRYIIVVVGGPILTTSNGNQVESNNDLTQILLKRWLSGELVWEDDLSGPFAAVIVDKETAEHHVMTDLMSFVPIFYYEGDEETVVSSHVDVLACVTEREQLIDQVSIADFVLHGATTYPYTAYEDIYQLRPGSETIVTTSGVLNNPYWTPEEKKAYQNINEAARELDRALTEYTNQIVSRTHNIAQFISGGEDSRLLASMLKSIDRDSFIFLDQFNEEGRMAQSAAIKNGARFHYALRKSTHYIDIFPEAIKLTGSNNQYYHAHTYGFHESLQLNQYDAVFGGLFADALLKGARIKKYKFGGTPYAPELKVNKNITSLNAPLFKNDIIRKIEQRRSSHYEYLKTFRPKSADEWFEIWPSSMNKSLVNLYVNRRLFRSYEPFLSHDVVKLSAYVPQTWKMNRRLFHRTAKPYLKTTKYLVHSDGRLPYYKWYTNIPIAAANNIKTGVMKKLGYLQGVQGPWNDQNALIQTESFKEWFDYLKEYETDLGIKDFMDLEEFKRKSGLESTQYLNMLQALYIVKMNHQKPT